MIALAMAAALAGVPPAQPAPSAPTVAELSAPQMFALAEAYQAEGRFADAETVLEALTGDLHPEIRTEARFRLGQSRMERGDYRSAAGLFAAILAEKPDAQAVRLELARALALQGRLAGAGRQLRQAQAGGLPPDVQQLVDRFASVLRSSRPWGGGLEVGLAPDTNVNQATTATTIDFHGLPLTIDSDGRARAGIGFALAGNGYVRLPIGGANLVSRAAVIANLYERSRFNDIAASFGAGPELAAGQASLRPALTYSHRRFGGATYSEGFGGALELLAPAGRLGQVEIALAASDLRYRIPEQSGTQFSAVAGIERALSPRLFGRVQALAFRHSARAHAFSTTSLGGGATISREAGETTLYLRGAYLRTEGDEPFALFGTARRDDRAELSAGIAWKRWSVLGLSPLVRIEHTVNHSSLELYRFDRTRLHLALAQRF